MNKHARRAVWSVVLCWGFSLSAHAALTGPQMAMELNQRFADDSSACVVDKPAFYCSGVLVRALPAAHTATFWSHDAVSTTVGAEGFAYLRADVGTRSLGQPSGLVFSSYLAAVAQGKSLDVLCAYPLVSQVDAARSDFGCAPSRTVSRSFNGHAQSQEDDRSSCALSNVGSASQWLAHFAQVGGVRHLQCSFSSRVAVQFKASLEAHRQTDASAEPMELRVRNWDASAPARMPLDALFYDVNQSNALLAAQRDQLDYFTATGEWLPVLRLNLQDSPGAVFGFDIKDQLYRGYQVAADINARYANTAPVCTDAQASFYCNGVLIRGAEASAAFHAWNPSPNSQSRNGVSFTYLRADSKVKSLAGTAGFIFRASQWPVAHPATLRCAYPANAGTSGIPGSCRASCRDSGVTTGEAWRSRYSGSPGSSCAFTPDADAFQLSLQVRSYFSSTAWNEIIIAAWPQNIPKQLPLEAFFYSSNGLAAAQFIQKDYFVTTARYLPIVKLDLNAAVGSVFSFDPQVQVVKGL